MRYSFYGNVALEKGSYTWKLKLIRRGRGERLHPFIGFIVDDEEVLKEHTRSYDYYYSFGYIFCGGDETCGWSTSKKYPPGPHEYSDRTKDGALMFNNDGDVL